MLPHSSHCPRVRRSAPSAMRSPSRAPRCGGRAWAARPAAAAARQRRGAAWYRCMCARAASESWNAPAPAPPPPPRYCTGANAEGPPPLTCAPLPGAVVRTDAGSDARVDVAISRAYFSWPVATTRAVQPPPWAERWALVAITAPYGSRLQVCGTAGRGPLWGAAHPERPEAGLRRLGLRQARSRRAGRVCRLAGARHRRLDAGQGAVAGPPARLQRGQGGRVAPEVVAAEPKVAAAAVAAARRRAALAGRHMRQAEQAIVRHARVPARVPARRRMPRRLVVAAGQVDRFVRRRGRGRRVGRAGGERRSLARRCCAACQQPGEVLRRISAAAAHAPAARAYHVKRPCATRACGLQRRPCAESRRPGRGQRGRAELARMDTGCCGAPLRCAAAVRSF